MEKASEEIQFTTENVRKNTEKRIRKKSGKKEYGKKNPEKIIRIK